MANVLVEEESLQSIADSIRKKTGSEEKLTPVEMAGAIDGISNKSEYDIFWDTYQDNGNRTDYSGAFGSSIWTNDTFKPKYDIIPTLGVFMFAYTGISGDLTKVFEENGVKINFNSIINMSNMFSNAKKITRLGTFDLRSFSGGIYNMFSSASELLTVDEIIFSEPEDVSKTVKAVSFFVEAPKISNVKITGKFLDNMNFNKAANLTDESIQSIIDALADATTLKKQTITFHSSVVDRLTDEQFRLILSKNWELI